MTGLKSTARLGATTRLVKYIMRAREFETADIDRDRILADLCEMILQGQKKDHDHYGMVAAAVVDPQGRVVPGINYRRKNSDQRVHAERAAIDAYTKRYGKLPQGSAVITTLSPCSEHMDDRYGESCEQLLKDLGITDIYCGYQDPTQDSGYTVTKNAKLEKLCKAIADTFLGDQQLNELTFMGMSQCTKDCSGHEAGYAWSKARGGASAASWSPSFNKGAEIASLGY